PPVYHIKKTDTLQGIALRLGVNGRALCDLNQLPVSTLSTTPHLLHTRTYLHVPASAYGNLPSSPADDGCVPNYQAARDHERVVKRLQVLTKEADSRVAQTYVHLACDPDLAVQTKENAKELGLPLDSSRARPSVYACAVDQYLDDAEWEQAELRRGQ
ncbi:hypothetical protein FISHEDRAFT_18180, partial [Fistulina hepatica ATCC 64428]